MSHSLHLIRALGTGGMATVHEAWDERLRRKVAIKIPSSKLADDREFLGLFFAEAAKMARVSHPHVLVIHGIEEDRDPPWMVMELADGGTLRRRLERGPVAPPDAASILRQVLLGLGAIHRRRIVHRDIKPENILRCGELYKIGDFGVAKADGDPTVGMLTPKYAAPESQTDHSTSRRSDLYSLGLVAYELLLGSDAFDRLCREELERVLRDAGETGAPAPADAGGDALPWFRWHRLTEDLPPPHRLAPAVPERLSWIVHGMARKDPLQRYPGCREVLDDLDAVEAGLRARSASAVAERELTEAVPEPVSEVPEGEPGIDAAGPAVETAGDLFLDGDRDVGTAADLVIAPPGEPAAGDLPVAWSGEPAAPGPDLELRKPAADPPREVAAPPASLPPPRRPRRWLKGLAGAATGLAALLVAGWLWLDTTRGDAFRHLEARRYAAAAADLDTVVRWRPDDTRAILACARAHYQLRNYGRSEALLERLLGRLPDDPEVLLYRGLVDLANDRPEDAVARFEAASALDAERAETLFYLGFAHYESRQYSQARLVFERFLDSGSSQQALVGRSRAFVERIERLAAPGLEVSGGR